MSELLPCPCCGGVAYEFESMGLVNIECSTCFLASICVPLGQEAHIERWNRRVTPTPEPIGQS
jgi:hypothetical protein